VVRTISFKLLYGLVILGDGRRRLARVGVTSNPIAEWITGQVTEAFLGTKHLDIDSRLRTSLLLKFRMIVDLHCQNAGV
jgi:hypothetical protein